MRLTNRHKKPLYDFLKTVIIAIILLCLGLYLLEKLKFNLLGIEENLLLLIPLLIIILFYLRGRQIFEYDSDSETLTIKNKNNFLFWSKISNDEFPKYKILSYNILNLFIIKKLYIVIHSKKHQSVRLKYDISYLTKKEVNDIKYSLSKIIQDNKKKSKINDN